MGWLNDDTRGIGDPLTGNRGIGSATDAGTEAWTQARRRRRVGDPLGQRIHDLLWQPIAPDDVDAIGRRLAELRLAFQAVLPAERSKLVERLETGDLAADFKYRLSAAARTELLAVLRAVPATGTQQAWLNRATSAAGPSSPPSSPGVTPQLSPSLKPQEPLTGQERGMLHAAIAVPIKLGSRRIFSRRVGSVAVFGTISGELKFTLLDDTRANLEVYTELSRKGPQQIEVTVANAIFGANAKIKADRNKDGSYSYKLGVDVGGISIDFSASPLSPVTIELPPMKVTIASLKNRLPALGLEGRADLELTISFDLVPDYARVASLAKAGGRPLATLLRNGAKHLGRAVVRVPGVAVRALMGGRRAWSWIVEKLLRGLGRAIANQWAEDLKVLGGRATMIGAAGKVARRYGGRLFGVAGFWLMIKDQVDEVVARTIQRTVENQRRKMLEAFRVGYATMLVDLTRPSWKSWFETVRSRGVPREVWKHRPPGKLEDWVKKNVNYSALDEWLEKHSTKPEKSMIQLATDDWHQRLIEAEVAAVFGLRPRSANGEQTRRRAYDEARIAGEAACYQDVIQFLAAHADAESVRAGLTPDSQWNGVIALHDLLFAGDDYTRQLAYVQLVDFDQINIPPFSE
jgi:hypothetical protein